MKAERIFLENVEEHDQHHKLGLTKKPPIQTLSLPFYFNINCVTEAFVTTDGHITIFISGRSMILKFDKKTWLRLIEHLGN
jgi:hypothetical protein